MRKQFKHQNGSVLLESLVATVIFAIGILGLVVILVRTTTDVNDVRARDEIFMAAQSAVDYTRLNSKKTGETGGEVSVADYLQDENQYTFKDGKKDVANIAGECQLNMGGTSKIEDQSGHLGPTRKKYISHHQNFLRDGKNGRR